MGLFVSGLPTKKTAEITVSIDYHRAKAFLEQFPLTRLQALRILAFAYTVACPKEDKAKDGLGNPLQRRVGSARLSEYFRDYQTFIAILDGCTSPDGTR